MRLSSGNSALSMPRKAARKRPHANADSSERRRSAQEPARPQRSAARVEEVVRRRRSARRWAVSSLVALGFAGLLASLSFVTWRQSRAFEELANLDHVEREVALAEAEQTELRRRIQRLVSRARISEVASVRFGMQLPDASEIVLITGEVP